MNILTAVRRARGGVHPRYNKQATAALPIAEMPLPALLRVSMAQQLGAPSKPLVKKGDKVLRGQKIGEAAGFISACVHAPTSGAVTGLSEVPAPSGAMAAAIDIEPDREDRWDPSVTPRPDWMSLGPKDLVGLVANAGIVGMGGAGFPTHVKLSPPADKPIDTLIVNGAECEPYLTADHRLMVERADAVWAGVEVLRRILGAKIVRVCIEDNKPDAIGALEAVMRGAQGDVGIVVLRTAYPQGAEKQQIYAVTGREVPAGGLPMDVGCLVENVATALAVRDAVVYGRPLTERVTTVTGRPIARPANVLARIGVSLADLVQFCGGLKSDVAKFISGGPMMGLAQSTLDTPTTKTTSGLLAQGPDEVVEYRSTPCIGCGRCVAACPANLVPSELSQMLEAEDYATAESFDVMDCIECGCCAFECPAHRPLVQHMRQGKAKVMAKRRAAQKK